MNLVEAKDEIARLEARVAELEASNRRLDEMAQMACENPREGCQCAGCLYAREAHLAEEADAREAEADLEEGADG